MYIISHEIIVECSHSAVFLTQSWKPYKPNCEPTHAAWPCTLAGWVGGASQEMADGNKQTESCTKPCDPRQCVRKTFSASNSFLGQHKTTLIISKLIYKFLTLVLSASCLAASMNSGLAFLQWPHPNMKTDNKPLDSSLHKHSAVLLETIEH